MLCLLALVAALVAWALVSGGGGGGHGSAAPENTHTPATTITPGPTPSGPHIGGQPGGRDTAPSGSTDGSTDGGANGGAGSGGSAGSGNDSSGSDSGSSAGAGSSGDGGAGTGGSTAGTGGSGGASVPGRGVPAGSSLPDCSPGPVSLSLSSVHNSYGPGQDPEFRLVATNSGAVTCKIDVGPKSAVFTVTGAPGSSHVWASDDCPTTGAHLLQVPANSSISYTLRWNEKTSSPQCAKPKGKQAAPGTYLVQLQMTGYGTHQTSFQVSQD